MNRLKVKVTFANISLFLVFLNMLPFIRHKRDYSRTRRGLGLSDQLHQINSICKSNILNKKLKVTDV